MLYYHSLNKYYNISNFSANKFASLPVWKKAALASTLALPVTGGIAGYMYGGIRHKNKLNELYRKLDSTINPLERAQIKDEINRVENESFLKRAGLIGSGLIVGGALQGAISRPLVRWATGT